MNTPVRLFVAAMVALGAASLLLGPQVLPDAAPDNVFVSVCGLAALGALAWALSHRLGKASIGSVSFIPWLAAILLSPSWVTVATIAVAVAAGEASRIGRTSPVKASFNVAQYIVALTVSGTLFLWLGGQPISVDERFVPIPYLVATVGFFVVNTASVAAVVALSERGSFAEIWRRNTLGNLVNDAIAIPVVFGFTLVVNRFGLAGIATIGALMLGLRQLYKVNAALETTNRELLEVLVHAIELRDPYTSGHSQRVARYSRIIGRAIGLSPKQLDRLAVAALLHDVGKIDQMFVPILSKPGKLTADERALMELHPTKSAELVSKVSELADIVSPVRHHHEAWDGSGYPDGLSGTKIPQFARIIAFADTIDAMLTDRPYRKALSRFEVDAELRRCRGTQFDPGICDALLASEHFGSLFGRSIESGAVIARRSREGESASGRVAAA
jgi:HD-GYP domain-containing protein (c-di-GMP phosphodiesterase class II)